MLPEYKVLGAGIATTGLSGVGIGIGNIFSSLLNATAMNPGTAKQCFSYAILGFALTEAIALFTIMIVFLILY
uniref:ATP synthase subunit 9, mitochondrial n=1 Tax=Acrasis kona TaxID=1008807 RepID=A0A0B4MZF7_9EUKA|nr:ATP synthase F0 subunit 9 [Acrasis kona]AID52036.1 ATP synthase F0 subunit 9 [Acrasis kona]